MRAASQKCEASEIIMPGNIRFSLHTLTSVEAGLEKTTNFKKK
jgi:hypothetical protein